MQESVWVSGCAAVLAGRSESRICLCCLIFVRQNPIRVGSAMCHVDKFPVLETTFQTGKCSWHHCAEPSTLHWSICAQGISSSFAALGCTAMTCISFRGCIFLFCYFIIKNNVSVTQLLNVF